MAALDTHPTVLAARQRIELPVKSKLSSKELKQLARDCGADDVGLISIDRSEIADQRASILQAFPSTRTLMSIVCRMNREPVRSVNRSVANLEFHQTTDHVNEVSREIVRRLEHLGVRAMNPACGFPMEMTSFPGKVWVVSHKPVAVAAGLGQMGVHRNVIHPKFGSFILLGTILLADDVAVEDYPIHYNPCLSCKLCVAACPVGAIKPDGAFDPSACLTHNYREFMNGFTDWVERIVESDTALSYRQKMTDQETASMWQSLSFGANYKAAYCLAVCPAGEEVIKPFLDDRAGFVAEQVKPLQQKAETIYVVPESDAEEYVQNKYPHKTTKRVSGPRPTSIAGFLAGMPIVFQAGKAAGLNVVYHFTFTGAEPATATVTIREQKLKVEAGHIGTCDCHITADSATWLGFLRKEKSIVWAVIRRKVRVKGPFRLLPAFGKCFPS